MEGNKASPHRPKRVVAITAISTALGPMYAGATERGICLLEFTDRNRLETQIKRLAKILNAEYRTGEHPHLTRLEQQLQQYFSGNLTDFKLPLDLPGTEFQQRVWQALQDIPYGRTRSYQQQAQASGNANAVRAVARANADNRIAIVVPCHRVIGKNGQLTGYAGGLWRKCKLLKLENAPTQNSLNL